jgi:hypothetical protein
MAGAIGERAMEQIRGLNDADLLLKAHVAAGDADWFNSALNFVSPPRGKDSSSEQPDAEKRKFGAGRVRFLLQTLANGREDLERRTAAVQLLLMISSESHPYSGPVKVLPIDGGILVDAADQIRAAAMAIFDDETQDGRLRGLCLQFLSLDDAEIVADAKRVYERTRSDAVRFAIEDLFLHVSDDFYASLKPPGGDAASLVSVQKMSGCADVAPGNIVFLFQTHDRKDFYQKRFDGLAVNPVPVLRSIKSGHRFAFPHYHNFGGFSSSDRTGQTAFELDELEGVPAGAYTLGIEYGSGEKIYSKGYTLRVKVANTASGKGLAVERPAR